MQTEADPSNAAVSGIGTPLETGINRRGFA
jgi:hypothetical protein